MGLDVYTYTKEQHEQQEAFDTKWGDSYPEKGTPEHDTWKKDWESVPSATDVKSVLYPDNINNRRYLRSSYNSGGFNTYEPHLTRNEHHNYYWVFSPVTSGDDYVIKCTDLGLLQKCRERAFEIVGALEEAKSRPTFNVMTESPTPLGNLTDVDAQQALEIFDAEAQRNEESPWGGGYSNRSGTFWPDAEPIQLVAAINGKDVLGLPALHLIYRTDFPTSYLESAYVLVEFIEELITLVKADGVAYMHWSG
jgi:hypothetical protein